MKLMRKHLQPMTMLALCLRAQEYYKCDWVDAGLRWSDV